MENLNIYTKLSAIQQELKAPKGQYNSFGKYKYRSCEDILEAVKPICGKYKTVLMLADSIECIDGRFYVKATATLCDCEGNKDVSVTALAREPSEKKGMDDSQITGTASSYARKYALNGLFCIDDTKDADTDEYKKQSDRPSEAEMQRFVDDYKESVKAITCQDCKLPIAPREHGGKKYSAEQIKAGAMKKYGVPLCWDCMEKRKQ